MTGPPTINKLLVLYNTLHFHKSEYETHRSCQMYAMLPYWNDTHGITYSIPTPQNNDDQFHSYADAEYNTDSSHSTSGYIFILGTGSIT